MNEAHPLTSPMVVRSLDVKKDPFRPVKMVKNCLVLKYDILMLLVLLCILLLVHT